jgi:hypothetical protein
VTQLERIKQFFDQLEERTLYAYIICVVCSVALLMGVLVFFQHRSYQQLKKSATRLNQARETGQELLSRYERVREQEQAVTTLLEQDKSFRIVGYIDSTLATLNLLANRTASSQTAEPLEHPAQYNEITVNFTSELLAAFEKNERIYTKFIEVAKSPTQPSIDVSLAVATLQPRVEGAPA